MNSVSLLWHVLLSSKYGYICSDPRSQENFNPEPGKLLTLSEQFPVLSQSVIRRNVKTDHHVHWT